MPTFPTRRADTALGRRPQPCGARHRPRSRLRPPPGGRRQVRHAGQYAGGSRQRAAATSRRDQTAVAPLCACASSPIGTAAPPPSPPVTAVIAPDRPVNPNKAFEPPPGWTPPGQTAATPLPRRQLPRVRRRLPPPPPPAPTPAADPAPHVRRIPTRRSIRRRVGPESGAALLRPHPAGRRRRQARHPCRAAAAAAPPHRRHRQSRRLRRRPRTIARGRVAPARPANPNKAFEPPPGWTPPAEARACRGAAERRAGRAPPPPAAMTPVPPPGSEGRHCHGAVGRGAARRRQVAAVRRTDAGCGDPVRPRLVGLGRRRPRRAAQVAQMLEAQRRHGAHRGARLAGRDGGVGCRRSSAATTKSRAAARWPSPTS